MNSFLAHSANVEGVSHNLKQHLVDVARRAKEFAAKFGASSLGYWAGLWHDLGKFTPDFQSYLLNPSASHGPDHSSAGMIHALRYWDGLAFLVAGHHAGLPSPASLKKRIGEKQNAAPVRLSLEIATQILVSMAPHESLIGQLPPFIQQPRAGPAEAKRELELFLRLLFSALCDADFLDTEAHFQAARTAARSGAPTLESLWEQFQQDQDQLTGQSNTTLQQARHAVYRACLEAANLLPGLFRLTVPTGGGKTRSGLAFALRHAIAHGLDRVIVAIPYTSIIEQTADVYREIFKDLGEEAVLEHHSAVDDDDKQDSPVTARQQWARLASENWDAPLVVTTTVQLFESLFAHRPGRCRKLHNVTRSVLILDEVQTLPPHLLDPILDGLNQLVRHYGVTVVLCTATQPALTANRYFNNLADVREIVPEPERLFRALQRVNYVLPGEERWDWGQVAREMRSLSQALAVVNTKKDALALIDALGENPSVLHLSTLLCGAHRADVLQKVRQRLKAGEPCRLVSTQVVEAGVDLDFPLVLRAIGPLDRIVQAAGRCNRENKLPEGGRVVIFDPAEGGSLPGAYRTGLDTAAGMLRQGCDLHDPLTYERYFTLLFQGVDTDREKIQKLRQSLDFPEVAKRFRLIDDDGAPIVVRPPGREATVDSLLAALRHASDRPRWAIRKLQRFVVNVRSRLVSAYETQGLLHEVAPGVWEWMGSYDPLRGLVDTAHDPDQLVS
jgi:CRISPR-associated endonuclease/helicase Cas3